MANPPRRFESPMFVEQMVENSPMTNLALNLDSTSISYAARRKLSLPSDDSLLDSPMMVSPLSAPNSDRLLKTSLRFSSPVGSGTPVRRVGVARRQLSNENFNPMQSSPVKQIVSPSKFQAVRQLTNITGRPRQPLEDHDPNSQDSGYCHSEDSKSTSLSSDFCFVQPNGLAPRRSTAESPRSPRITSTSSNESSDDGFLDFISPLEDEEAQLPPALGGLISEPIINTGVSSESANFFQFRHCISENITHMSPVVEESSPPPVASKKRQSHSLENTPVSKRYKPLSDSNSPQQNTLFQYGFKRISEPRPLLSHSVSLDETVITPYRPKFRHCLSESEAVIKNALHRSSEEELIGDFSQKFALPLVNGSHQDLKSISPVTLARLINGEFSNAIESFEIIDCRYPYEFDGGHIRGARNIYTRDQLMKEFLESRPALPMSTGNKSSGRHIIIFHCEFSSERGPGLSRFLRSKDRECNAYPALHHPELYLLEGGYKAFFTAHQELCEPCAYRRMVDADKGELQHFRTKSKTWSGDRSQRVLKRSTSFKRLGL